MMTNAFGGYLLELTTHAYFWRSKKKIICSYNSLLTKYTIHVEALWISLKNVCKIYAESVGHKMPLILSVAL